MPSFEKQETGSCRKTRTRDFEGSSMNKHAFYNNIERWVCIVLLILMIAISFLTIITRFVFNFTLSWAEQLVRFFLVWISFAGISWAGSTDAHMRVTAISLATKTHPKVFGTIYLIGDLVAACYGFFLSYRIAKFMIMVMKQGQVLSAIPWIPKWLMYLAGVIGMAGMGIRILQRRYYMWKQPADVAQGVSK